MEYKIWMASDWKNNVSGTFYAVAAPTPNNPLPPFGFFMDFIACSEINTVTVLLLNTNFIQGVVQILHSCYFTSRKGRYLSFWWPIPQLDTGFIYSGYEPDVGTGGGWGCVGFYRAGPLSSAQPLGNDQGTHACEGDSLGWSDKRRAWNSRRRANWIIGKAVASSRIQPVDELSWQNSGACLSLAGGIQEGQFCSDAQVPGAVMSPVCTPW